MTIIIELNFGKIVRDLTLRIQRQNYFSVNAWCLDSYKYMYLWSFSIRLILILNEYKKRTVSEKNKK